MASNTATLQIRIQVDKAGSVEIVEKTFNNIRNVSKKAMTQAMKDQRDYWQAYDSFQKKSAADALAIQKKVLAEEQAVLKRKSDYERQLLAAISAEKKKVANEALAAQKKVLAEEQALLNRKNAYEKQLLAAINAEKKKINAEALAAQKKLGADMAAEVKYNMDAEKAKWAALGVRSKQAIDDEIALVKMAAAEKQAIYAKGSREWERIENAKNAKLKQLNNEMVGHHEMSMAAMTRAVLRFYAAWYVAQALLSGLKNFVMDGVKSIDDMKISSIAVAAQLTTMQGTTGNIVENYKKNVEYAKALIPVLQQVDAASLASFEQIQAMHMAMTMVQGPLNINSSDQVKAFTALTNIVSLYAQGADKMKQARQEIGAIFRGETKQSDLAAKALDEQIKRVGVYKDGLKGLVEEGRKHGDTLQRLKPYLIGIEAATGDISETWEAVGSSIDTAFGMIQRELFKDLYKDLIIGGQKAVEWTKANAAEIADAIKRVSKDIVFGLAAVGVASVNFSKIWKVMATDVVVSNSKMARSFGVFVSGIVGYEIGRFLYGEFETVRKAGVAMVYGLASSWDWLMEKMAKGWEYVKSIAKLAWNPDDAMQIIKQTKANIKAIEDEYKAKKKFNDKFRAEQLKAVADQNFYKKQKQGDGVPYPDITGGVDLAALEAEEQARKQAADAAKAQAEKIAEVIANLQWELSIVGMAEEEQAALNAVRSAGADLASKEGQQIYNLTKQLDAEKKAIQERNAEWDEYRDFMSDEQQNEMSIQLHEAQVEIQEREWAALIEEAERSKEAHEQANAEIIAGWEHTRDKIQDSISGMFSGAMKGELENGRDLFESFADSMADVWSASFTETLLKNLSSSDFVDDLGYLFEGIFGKALSAKFTNKEIAQGVLGTLSAAMSAISSGNKYQMGGAALGGIVGAYYGGPVGAAVGSSIGNTAGSFFQSSPSYGEQLAKAMDALAEKTDLNTTATQTLTREMLAGKDYSAGGLISKYFSPKLLAESVTGNKSLLESLALPMIKVLENGMLSIRADFTDKGNRNAELIYKAFDRSGLGETVPRKIELGGDYGRRNATAAEINTLFTSLFDATSKEGINGLVRVVKALDSLTKTGDVTLLFDELAKLPEYSAIATDKVRELFRAFETEYESGAKLGRNTKNATENMIAEVWATIENEVTSSFLSLIPTLEGLGEQYDVALAGSFTDADGALQQLFNTAFTAKDKALESVDDTFENVKTEVDNLKALSASNLINLDPKIQAFIDSFDGAIATIKQGIDDFYATARATAIAARDYEMQVALGFISGMEQRYKSITDAADEYRLELIDLGMATDEASAKASEYAQTMKDATLAAQLKADRESYAIRILQAQGDEIGALTLQREAELQAIDDLYGAGSAAAIEMRGFAEELFKAEDAAKAVAEATFDASDSLEKLADMIQTIADVKLTMNDVFGNAFDPALFLQSIGINGTGEKFNALLNQSSMDGFYSSLNEFSRLLQDGSLTSEQYSAVTSLLIDRAREFQTALDEASERLSAVGAVIKDASAWYKDIMAQYTGGGPSEYQKAVSEATSAMEELRQRLIETGHTVSDSWKEGGAVEQAVVAAIRTSFLKDLKSRLYAEGDRSSYLQGLDDIGSKRAGYQAEIDALINVAKNTRRINEDIPELIVKLLSERDAELAKYNPNDPNYESINARYAERIDYWGQVQADLMAENAEYAKLTEKNTNVANNAIRALKLDLLQNVRGAVYDITGDVDLLSQTYADMEKALGKMAADDYGGQYEALMDMKGILEQMKDIAKANLEETISNYQAIDDVLNELRGGSLAPVQSREWFDRRYAQLYDTAMETGKAADVTALTGFVAKYADFMKSYGGSNYKDFTEKLISDFEALQVDISGGKTLDELYTQLDTLNETYMAPILNQLIAIGNLLAKDTKSGTISSAIGDVPGFASGGTFIAGESGAEIVRIGAGSSARIFNADDTATIIANAVSKAINGAVGGGNQVIQVNVKLDSKDLKNATVDVLRTNPDARREVRHIMRAA